MKRRGREKRTRRSRGGREGRRGRARECARRLRKLSRRCVFTRRFTGGQRAFDLHARAPRSRAETAKRVLEVKYATGCARTTRTHPAGVVRSWALYVRACTLVNDGPSSSSLSLCDITSPSRRDLDVYFSRKCWRCVEAEASKEKITIENQVLSLNFLWISLERFNIQIMIEIIIE